MHVSAATRFKPRPPARVDSRKTEGDDDGDEADGLAREAAPVAAVLEKRATLACRSARQVLPSRRQKPIDCSSRYSGRRRNGNEKKIIDQHWSVDYGIGNTPEIGLP